MKPTANISSSVSRVRNWPGRCRNIFRKMRVRFPLSVTLIAALSGCYSYNDSTVTITVGNHTILPELSSRTGEYKLTIFHTIDGLHVTFPATSNNSAEVSIAYTNNTAYSVGYGLFNSTNIKSLAQYFYHNNKVRKFHGSEIDCPVHGQNCSNTVDNTTHTTTSSVESSYQVLIPDTPENTPHKKQSPH